MTETIRKNLAIFGSTGSIGESALDVCRTVPGMRVVALSGNRNLQRLWEQGRGFPEAALIACDPAALQECGVPDELRGRLQVGSGPLVDWARAPETDLVLAAIVGSAGLASTAAAIGAGKTVALANKESLVMAGSVLMPLAASTGARVLPVDSEHSAVLQCLMAGRREEVSRIILTASGGPFRDWSLEQMRSATPEQATRHPTWQMGPKISVDSATMMNKALEIVEAAWLFGLDADRIGVMIHPQSLVHGLVEFRDGSVVAQMGPPDMRLPIQYAFTWPERVEGPARRFDWSRGWQLELLPPDDCRFPALQLGYEAVRRGGTAGAVLNAANEVAVAAFLAGRLGFHEIVPACSELLAAHQVRERPDLQDVVRADLEARKEMERWILER